MRARTDQGPEIQWLWGAARGRALPFLVLSAPRGWADGATFPALATEFYFRRTIKL